MAKRQRARVQTWPIKFIDQATVIKSQNELLLLDLLMSHQELKLNNPGKLEEVLPSLKERVRAIYQTAQTVGGGGSRTSRRRGLVFRSKLKRSTPKPVPTWLYWGESSRPEKLKR